MATRQIKLAQFSNQVCALITVFVINENEYSSVRKLISEGGWVESDTYRNSKRTRYSLVQYHCDAFQKDLRDDLGVVKLELVKPSCSGNLPMSITVMDYYEVLDTQAGKGKADSVVDRYSILFGCAGRIASPKSGEGASSCNAPEAFIVSDATWAEQGKCSTHTIGAHVIDVTEIKVSRLGTLKATCPPTFRSQVKKAFGGVMANGRLAEGSAICFDKVIEVDLKQQNEMTCSRAPDKMLLTYRELLDSGNYAIVDMESYGYLVSHPKTVDNVLVIRIPTDSLDDHTSSSDSRQSEILEKCAYEYLRPILHMVAEIQEGRLSGSETRFSAMAVLNGGDIERYIANAVETAAASARNARGSGAEITREQARKIVCLACNCFPPKLIDAVRSVQDLPFEEAVSKMLQRMEGLDGSVSREGARLAFDLVLSSLRGHSTYRINSYQGYAASILGDHEGCMLDWIELCDKLNPITHALTYQAALNDSCSRIFGAPSLSDAAWNYQLEGLGRNQDLETRHGRFRVNISHFGLRVAAIDVHRPDMELDAIRAKAIQAARNTVIWRGYEDDHVLEKAILDCITEPDGTESGAITDGC